MSRVLISAVVMFAMPLLIQPVYAESCEPPGKPELAVVAYVYDGDTVRLKDGRRVRLLGINTTEIGRDGDEDQRFAKAAKQVLEKVLSERPRVKLYFDQEKKDHYGRHLAHIYVSGNLNTEHLNSRSSNPEPWGFSLEQALLRQGLAYHVAIPPNLALASCFKQAEQRAQQQGLGLWGRDGIQPTPSTQLEEGGYQRVQGKVVRVAFADAWWIELEGGLSIVIYPEHQHRFTRQQVAAWRGQSLLVEGWVYRSKGRGWRIKLETPYGVSESMKSR